MTEQNVEVTCKVCDLSSGRVPSEVAVAWYRDHLPEVCKRAQRRRWWRYLRGELVLVVSAVLFLVGLGVLIDAERSDWWPRVFTTVMLLFGLQGMIWRMIRRERER